MKANTYYFTENAKLPLILYGSNLAFNYAWTPIFFNAKKIDLVSIIYFKSVL